MLTHQKITQPPLEINNRTITEPDEQANRTANFFENLFINRKASSPKTTQKVAVSVTKLLTLPPQQGYPQITTDALEAYLKHLSTRKSPGADGIPNTALKRMRGSPLQQLVTIINATLKFQQVPTS